MKYYPTILGDYFISQYKDPVLNQPGFNGISTGFSSLLNLNHLKIAGLSFRLIALTHREKLCFAMHFQPKTPHVANYERWLGLISILQ